MMQTYDVTGDRFFWHAAHRLEIEGNIRNPERSQAQRMATIEGSVAKQLSDALAEIGQLKRQIAEMEAAEALAEDARDGF